MGATCQRYLPPSSLNTGALSRSLELLKVSLPPGAPVWLQSSGTLTPGGKESRCELREVGTQHAWERRGSIAGGECQYTCSEKPKPGQSSERGVPCPSGFGIAQKRSIGSFEK